jgi:hypothetical protein
MGSAGMPFVCKKCRKLNRNWYTPCPHAEACLTEYQPGRMQRVLRFQWLRIWWFELRGGLKKQ